MDIHDSNVHGFFAVSSTSKPGTVGKLLGKSSEVKGSIFLQESDGKIVSVSGKLLKNTEKAEKKALKDKKCAILTILENGVNKKVLVEIDNLATKLGLSDEEKKRLSSNPQSLQSVLAHHNIKTTDETRAVPLSTAMQKAGLSKEEIDKIQNYVNEHLPEMVKVATERGGAAKFSRKLPQMQARGINFSLSVTRTGQVFLHANRTLGRGGFKTARVNIGAEDKAVRAMQNRETVEHNPTMLKQEYQFHERFQGPGFMKVFGFLDYKSAKTGEVRKGILSAFYPFDMKKIISTDGLKSVLTPKAKLSAMLQLAAALTKMHSENVVHLDLKPENVYLKWDPTNPAKIEVGLGDFGSAQEVNKESVKTMDRWASTPDYAPPEKSAYRAITSGLVKDVPATFGIDLESLPQKGDIFSLGKTFLEWHRGAPISQDAIAKFGAGAAPSDPVENLCWRMIQSEPKNRPPANEVFAILERITA